LKQQGQRERIARDAARRRRPVTRRRSNIDNPCFDTGAEHAPGVEEGGKRSLHRIGIGEQIHHGIGQWVALALSPRAQVEFQPAALFGTP